MSKKAKQVGQDLLEDVTRRKKGPGLETPLAETPMGLVRVSSTEQAMSLVGDPAAPAVSATRTQAVAGALKKSEGELGLRRKGRTMPRGHGVRQRDVTVSVFEPRVNRLKVHGARVAVGLATERGGNRKKTVGVTSDARIDAPTTGRFHMKPPDVLRLLADDMGMRASNRNIQRLLDSSHVRIEKVLSPEGEALRRAYRVTPLGLRNPRMGDLFDDYEGRSAQFVVDADTGEILRKHPMSDDLRATVSAYDENPVKSPRNIDRTSLIVDGRPVDINAAAGGTTQLRNAFFNVVPGQYVTVNATQTIKARAGRATGSGSAASQFVYAYNDRPNVSEANTFVHLNRAREMLLRIDSSFTVQTAGAAGQPMDVYVDIPATSFNALSYRDGHLEFWANGGVGAADDAEIVVHEYGHQVHFVLAPNVFASEVGEGVADFIAAIYAHDSAISELFPNRNLVTSAAILAADYMPPLDSLREAYNDQRYPEDYVGGGHSRSRILSGALYELHLNMYTEFGDEDYNMVARTLLAALPLMPAGAGLLDAAGTFAGLVALVTIFTSDPKWARLASHTSRAVSAPWLDLGLRDAMGVFDGWVPLTAEVMAKEEAGSLLAAASSVVDPEVRTDELTAVLRRWATEAKPKLERVVPLGDGLRAVLVTQDRELSSDAPAVDALSRAIVWCRLRSTGVVSVRAWGEAVVRNSAAAKGTAPAAGSIRKGEWDRFEVVCRTTDGHEWVAYIDPTGVVHPKQDPDKRPAGSGADPCLSVSVSGS